MTDESIERLTAGTAFVDLSFWRKVDASGADAGAWLQDLVSADLVDMDVGRSRQSLLLSPTGRVRAEFTVARTEGGWLLLQDPAQARPVDELLAPYVLSSDVSLADRTEALALFALPGHADDVKISGAQVFTPSCLGGGGLDLIGSIDDHRQIRAALEAGFVGVGNEAVEEWRVLAGIPKFGVEATEEDLPQEAGLDEAVGFDKGCYLGQEAVAKVRNLGHPRRLVIRLRADGTVSPGDAVRSDGKEVGLVTSTAAIPDGTVLFARVAWAAREGPFESTSGTPLVPRQAGRPV